MKRPLGDGSRGRGWRRKSWLDVAKMKIDGLGYKRACAAAAVKARRSAPTVRHTLRDVRVVVLIVAIFVLGIFDLLLTLGVYRVGLLDELNPVGHAALGRGVATLITFKICLTIMGCLFLLLARTTASGKFAAIGIFIMYAVLAAWWCECVSEFDRLVADGSTYQVVAGDDREDV